MPRRSDNFQPPATQPPAPKTTPEYLDESQVSELLGITVRTLQQWRHQKRELSYVKAGKLVRYRRSDVLAYMEKNVVTVAS